MKYVEGRNMINKFVEVAMLALMFLSIVALFLNRQQLRRGIVGMRSIQFVAVVFILPMTVILAMEGKLDTSSTAFVFGTIIGYVLQHATDEKEDNLGTP
jgi:hypothetical protein